MSDWKPLSPPEVSAIRTSGNILVKALREVVEQVRPGVSADALDATAEQAIRTRGGTPSFKGYRGYPASLCVSVNSEVVHGIPTRQKVLRKGDVVGLDLGVMYGGMYTDMATTVALETSDQQIQKLLTATRDALAAGLRSVRAGATTGDIGAVVQAVAERHGCGIVRDLVGHGVGRELHDDPSIPNFGIAGSGSRLREGMTIAVEPMFTTGDFDVITDPDGWTVRTADGSRAAHEERTVMVTRNGYELLTPW